MLRTMLDRQRARYQSERIDEVVGEDSPNEPQGDLEEGTIAADDLPELQERDDEDDLLTTTVNNNTQENANTSTILLSQTTATSLAELEEERELARRRSSACVMFSVFILFRLWMEAIQTGDFTLLLLSLFGTSWTARWIRHNREEEEELELRIQNYIQNQGTTALPQRNDLRMLSFQAQLALAIMESQRQMMAGGGYGHAGGNETPGVTDAAKEKWHRFSYKAVPGAHKAKTEEEEPHCSICLCEYEDADNLVKLPCSHVYHDPCIASWTTNHVRCPLCNFDLEDVDATPQQDDTV
jgi:hypothetical protein